MMTNHASYASTETACAKTRAVMEGRMRSDEHQLKGASRGGAASRTCAQSGRHVRR